ncbi:succinate dehydrogenase/fumarate reductase flavoprotein subunit [Paraburkholderia unamae]|uniref:FAD-binding protein n=1 Tax=Paraburkholderia unamae TaxID=219649 RepID=UPI000DC2C5D1|nr:FAD-binding protein [Paraburkholderia unamae]RAR61185.1 succinate dehydrogenase/fumarate reductase flavoprotein subunit [Paraburkholderia unamae]
MGAATQQGWDEEVDLLIFGAGAAGMTAALVADHEKLKVLLCEKTGMVGGITSTSGGTTWVPGTTLSAQAGVPDSVDDARRFLASVVGARGGDEAREAFLQSGPQVIDELARISDVKFVAATAHPDYVSGPGAAFGGRALVPAPFDARVLGKAFARVRPPRKEFMGLGGMMVARADLNALLAPFATFANFRRTIAVVGRYAMDRLRHPRGTQLVMGNALAARLYYSLCKRDIEVRFESPLVELVREDGRVTGAVVATPGGGRRRIGARRGVVLATGGITRHPTLRNQLFPAGARGLSLAPQTHTGDGVDRARQVGANVENGGDSPGLWMPCSIRRARNSQADADSVWPHIILDRAKPGLIAVNSRGERFVNESDSYHDFVMGMLRDAQQRGEQGPRVAAHLIVDAAFIHEYGLGLLMPGRSAARIAAFERSGYLVKGATLAELAAKLQVDAAGLARTVDIYNRAATEGKDPAFERGSSPMNRFNGDASQQPNPCVRPIGAGPYYAVTVWPADLACSAGLSGNANGEVLDHAGHVIAGLFACGNDLASIFRGTYPGPGTTLGPAIVFGWRIAKYVANGGNANATQNVRAARACA